MSLLFVLAQVLCILFTGKMLLGKPVPARDWRVRTEQSTRTPGDDRPDPPEEGDGGLPPAGRTAPLRPRPGGHLVAANALPPRERTYLFTKD